MIMPLGKNAAARKDGKNNVYEAVQYNELNHLDQVARYILAVGYSGQYAGDNALRQGYINAHTVAVAQHGTELFVAINTLFYAQQGKAPQEHMNKIIGRVKAELISAGATDYYSNIYFIDNEWGIKDRFYHAEMQLVDFFKNNNWPLQGNMLGVSKPCCQKCAENLDKLKISYSYWHGVDVGSQYKEPKTTERWW
jgi:hypothetical protein